MDEDMYNDLLMSEICDDFGIPEEPGIWSVHAELSVEDEDEGSA